MEKRRPGRPRKYNDNDGDDVRTCTRCGKVKDVSEFYETHRGTNLRHSSCKVCQLEPLREKAKKLKQIIVNHYGGKCACCGETRVEFLTIHHIDGNGRAHRKLLTGHAGTGGTTFYNKIIQSGFPDEPKLDVLCYNCNCSYGFLGYCPHESETH